ncbi:MAG: hypothetical protein JWN17_602, partial [Frankiales bacterium]|nr:hypothetical protein [Frankiales bacterium]
MTPVRAALTGAAVAGLVQRLVV